MTRKKLVFAKIVGFNLFDLALTVRVNLAWLSFYQDYISMTSSTIVLQPPSTLGNIRSSKLKDKNVIRTISYILSTLPAACHPHCRINVIHTIGYEYISSTP